MPKLDIFPFVRTQSQLNSLSLKTPKKGRNILKASGSKIKSGSFNLANVVVPTYHPKLPLFTCRPYRCEISSLTPSVPCLDHIFFRFFSYTGWSVCVGPVQLVFFDMSLCRTILQVIGKHRCYGKLLSYWTCSFPMCPPVRRRSVAVGLSQFPKRAGSYTSMLLSERLSILQDGITIQSI